MVGAGGIGGYYGARLADSGAEVCFLARGAQFEALRDSGLTVESALGSVRLETVEVYSDPASMPEVDVALSCVKLYDAEKAAAICRTVLKPDGLAVSLQNGIDGPAILAKEVGEERTLAGSVMISAFIEAPGVIRHVGKNQAFHLETREGLATRLFEAVGAAGLQAKQIDDPDLLLWNKFVRLVSLSGVAVLSRSPLGFVAGNAPLRVVLQHLAEEAEAIGRALGLALAEGIPASLLEAIDKLPYEFKPSLLLDLEQGKRLEAPWLSGRLVELGRELGIPTPYHDAAWGAVQRFLEGGD